MSDWDEYKDNLREEAKKFTPVGRYYMENYRLVKVDEKTSKLVKRC